ncbi:hypothetical protein M8994_05545, partial [Brucella sp. 21LCYQ03]|nr:hypothetical protein [Brucella sp. 21LCYQ03]
MRVIAGCLGYYLYAPTPNASVNIQARRALFPAFGLVCKEGKNMLEARIRNTSLHDKIITAEEAASLIKDGMIVGMSGF